MSNDNQNLPADGLSDEGDSDRLLQGSRLICIDGAWTWGKDETAVPADKRFLALSTAEGQQHWVDGQLVEEIKKKPGEPFAKSVDNRNAEIPKNTWDDGIGGPRPPRAHQFAVYLLDPDDGAIYTYMNSTDGAAIAVRELRNKVKWTRALRGETRVLPVVTLGQRLVSKQYKKYGPDFNVVEWRNLNPELPPAQNAVLPAPQPDQLPGVKVEEPSLAKQMGDEMPPWNDSPNIDEPADKGGPNEAAPTSPLRESVGPPKPRITKKGVQKIARAR